MLLAKNFKCLIDMFIYHPLVQVKSWNDFLVGFNKNYDLFNTTSTLPKRILTMLTQIHTTNDHPQLVCEIINAQSNARKL